MQRGVRTGLQLAIAKFVPLQMMKPVVLYTNTILNIVTTSHHSLCFKGINFRNGNI